MRFWQILRTISLSLVTAAAAVPCLAQGSEAGRAEDGQESWGTESETLLVFPGLTLIPLNSTVVYGNFGPGRTCTAGTCTFVAPLQLPSGARVVRIELDGCDTSGTESVSVLMSACPNPSIACELVGEAFTVGSPGCGVFTGPADRTIDNANYVYLLAAGINGNGGDLLIRSVRVAYKLQVSPGPATATFADVPTSHPFFRFVEALAASGITAGCGGGNYCPDDPITRGQMAVFLASALGLHWAN